MNYKVELFGEDLKTLKVTAEGADSSLLISVDPDPKSYSFVEIKSGLATTGKKTITFGNGENKDGNKE